MITSENQFPTADDVVPEFLDQPGKRLLDCIISILLIVGFSWLLLAIVIAVKIWDRGPIFHRRRVVGRLGQFDAFKFRTMRPDADAWLAARPELKAEFERNFKLCTDPRITALGHWLRKTSLDELPQLFNVLMGQMSLVGPRMISPAELAMYGDHAVTLRTVRPGMTGYWQVFGRQQVTYGERVKMDMKYIRNWSMGLDLKILLLTPIAVIRGKGAY